MNALPRISVCICTFRRDALLSNLLTHLETQRTDGLFAYDVVVADNDSARSAEALVARHAASSRLDITYCAEPEENIALARNRAVASSTGDFVAFIDDDEEPVTNWLYELFVTRARLNADGVLGPVLARFDEDAPAWVTKGGFFDRPRHATGYRVNWSEARTGNVLLTRQVLRHFDPPFLAQFGSGGEDVDFFRRAATAGFTFVWSDEAIADEFVPPYRCTRRFLLRRAMLRGSNFPKQSAPRTRNVVKSLIAVPAYAVALPFLALAGQHRFMAQLTKLSEHGSRLLALAGMPLMTKRDT